LLISVESCLSRMAGNEGGAGMPITVGERGAWRAKGAGFGS